MKSMVELFGNIKRHIYKIKAYRNIRQLDVIDSLTSEKEGLMWLVEAYESERERLANEERSLQDLASRRVNETKIYHDKAKSLAQKLGDTTQNNVRLNDLLSEEIRKNSELTRLLADLQTELGGRYKKAPFGISEIPRLYLETFCGLLPKPSSVPIDQRDGNNHDHHSYMYRQYREFIRHVCELPWTVRIFCTNRLKPLKRKRLDYTILDNGDINLIASFEQHSYECRVTTTAANDLQRGLVAEIIGRTYEKMHPHKKA